MTSTENEMKIHIPQSEYDKINIANKVSQSKLYYFHDSFNFKYFTHILIDLPKIFWMLEIFSKSFEGIMF